MNPVFLPPMSSTVPRGLASKSPGCRPGRCQNSCRLTGYNECRHNASWPDRGLVIRSFHDQRTADAFHGRDSRAARKARLSALKRIAQRKLDPLSQAARLDDLRVPPGNQLEALKKDRRGRHAIRINHQHRICLVWSENSPERVEITDDHRSRGSSQACPAGLPEECHAVADRCGGDPEDPSGEAGPAGLTVHTVWHVLMIPTYVM